jgi:hypothetical protein
MLNIIKHIKAFIFNYTPISFLIINDKKKVSKFFNHRFLLFLDFNKSTPVSSKNDLILLLNKKPRLYVTGVQFLVSELKKFDNHLAYKLIAKKIHPQKIIKASKNKTTLNKDKNNSDPSKRKIKEIKIQSLQLLKSKIQSVKNLLINNKLAFPVNLLKPIIDSKSALRQVNLNKLGEFNYVNNKYNILNNNDQINELAPQAILIKKYNLKKNLHQLSNTKYLQLISAYKTVNKFQQNIKYNFAKYIPYGRHSNIKIENIITLLDYAFRSMSCLISKPVFLETPQKLVINLFYFFIPGKINKTKKKNRLERLGIPSRIEKIILNPIYITNKKKRQLERKKARLLRTKFSLRVLFSPKNLDKINKLCIILSRIFNKNVVLDLIPLKLPFFDDNILVKTIGIICNKVSVRTIFNFIFRKATLYSKVRANLKYKYSMTKSYLSGIKIRIGGRLMTQKVIPRISSREIQRGPISHRKVTFVD